MIPYCVERKTWSGEPTARFAVSPTASVRAWDGMTLGVTQFATPSDGGVPLTVTRRFFHTGLLCTLITCTLSPTAGASPLAAVIAYVGTLVAFRQMTPAPRRARIVNDVSVRAVMSPPVAEA